MFAGPGPDAERGPMRNQPEAGQSGRRPGTAVKPRRAGGGESAADKPKDRGSGETARDDCRRDRRREEQA